MHRRIEAVTGGLPFSRPRLAAALRQALSEGYDRSSLRADLMAGIVVGIVALPLSMALAIASGVPPQNGLYTAIVAGGLIAVLGGSRVQVSGPTAAFVVLLAPVSAQYGLAGLMIASVLAGGLLVAMGLARMGRLLQFIPNPVVTGFTAGIAVVIATLQVKDLLGLEGVHLPESWMGKVAALVDALPQTRLSDLAIGTLTLTVLLLWPRVTRRVPAPLVALTLGAAVAWAAGLLVPGFEVATIASRFGGIPAVPPLPALPWHAAGADGAPLVLSWELVQALLPPAFAIAMLGAIESLLSAVVADGMSGHQHDPDAELVAQGVGNLVAPFFGGFAATGAIARTATNIRAGGRSPVAAVVHALFVLAAVLLLSPLLGLLPMASLAALLLVVAWNMSEARHVVHVIKVAPKSDVMVLLTGLGLTVVFDMVVSVSVGVVLAALLFMRRMAEVAGVRLVGEPQPAQGELPPGVILYEVAGPLFFGAAQKAMGALQAVSDGTRVVVLDVAAVPVMDATGLVNLESLVDRLERRRICVVLAGAQLQPRRLLERAGLTERVTLVPDVEAAFERIRKGACPAEREVATPAAA